MSFFKKFSKTTPKEDTTASSLQRLPNGKLDLNVQRWVEKQVGKGSREEVEGAHTNFVRLIESVGRGEEFLDYDGFAVASLLLSNAFFALDDGKSAIETIIDAHLLYNRYSIKRRGMVDQAVKMVRDPNIALLAIVNKMVGASIPNSEQVSAVREMLEKRTQEITEKGTPTQIDDEINLTYEGLSLDGITHAYYCLAQRFFLQGDLKRAIEIAHDNLFAYDFYTKLNDRQKVRARNHYLSLVELAINLTHDMSFFKKLFRTPKEDTAIETSPTFTNGKRVIDAKWVEKQIGKGTREEVEHVNTYLHMLITVSGQKKEQDSEYDYDSFAWGSLLLANAFFELDEPGAAIAVIIQSALLYDRYSTDSRQLVDDVLQMIGPDAVLVASVNKMVGPNIPGTGQVRAVTDMLKNKTQEILKKGGPVKVDDESILSYDGLTFYEIALAYRELAMRFFEYGELGRAAEIARDNLFAKDFYDKLSNRQKEQAKALVLRVLNSAKEIATKYPENIERQ